MTIVKMPPDGDVTIEIELRDPPVAALLAWLWPGAGHIYQRRFGKAILYMVCILGIYFLGFAIGGGHVVYASFEKQDRRLPFICQVGVGIPALPAVVQAVRMHVLSNPNNPKEPLFNGFMAPPKKFNPDHRDELADWHRDFKFRFELGTLFTMVAGLLNILAVYDAGCGPVFMRPDQDRMPNDQKPNRK